MKTDFWYSFKSFLRPAAQPQTRRHTRMSHMIRVMDYRLRKHADAKVEQTKDKKKALAVRVLKSANFALW